jgi:aminoglycoside phosphotransferase (APT) family kinase protein
VSRQAPKTGGLARYRPGYPRVDNGFVNPQTETVQTWLRQLQGFEESEVNSVEPVSGGASNLTYRVEVKGTASARAVALRIQRKEGIFQPYSIVRETQVLKKLEASTLPVPRVLGVEWDREILGNKFAVLEWIDAPHMGDAGPEASFPAFTRAVASVHQLDWKALGLDLLGVPLNYENAILGEIAPVAKRMRAFEADKDPLLRRALSLLQSRRPTEGEIAFCQGDINVFNYLFRNGEVVGIVDWEQARLGDPRSDVGQLLALSILKGAPFGDVNAMPFLQAYEAAAGKKLEYMEYFRAFWAFQLTVIYHGWVKFNGSEPWFSLPQVSELLEASLAEID